MPRFTSKTSLLHLSVEEENLAAIPFAVLERRVGKKVGKIDITGTKLLPDGTEIRVCWQVQGNSDLGLPTEQDLDIFVALGVLTFRNNFAKTVTFSGREIAKILGIQSVHGKFYSRLKIAMDRFIPLRFRSIAESDRQEDVKWLNVFQEANFTLDRVSGRCTGSVTWTDKLIQSMNSGFFRVLDASRYMELDGITGKHLYRFLAVAFEKADFIVMDARKLALEHLGILNPPKYFSRLMQTLEPALDQLIRIEVLGAYDVIDSEKWQIALRRHAAYVPERKNLMLQPPGSASELSRLYCQKALERAGFPEKLVSAYVDRAGTKEELYQLERAAKLVEAFQEEGVLPHVALALIKKALDTGVETEEGREALDWCELAADTCRHKTSARQNVKNPAGLLVKIAKDPEAARKIVSSDTERAARNSYRQREQSMWAQHELAEQRELLMEYEYYKSQLGATLLTEMSENARQSLLREKSDSLKSQERFVKMGLQSREKEAEELVCQDLARKEAAPFEKWLARKRVRQAVLPFGAAMEMPA